MALLDPYASPLTVKTAAHLLRRATFGATQQQIKSLEGQGVAAAMNTLFHQTVTPPLDLELPIDPKTGSEWLTTGPTGANSMGTDLQEYFFGWFINQMMSPSLAHAAREKIVWFLHTHFTTIREKVNNSQSLYFQNQLFRMFALDQSSGDPDVNFKNLTVKVSVDNAMLVLLDGDLNVRGAVNENYARELLELYSIGRGLEYNPPPTGPNGDYGVYTEGDVQQAARVLSGWGFEENFAIIDEDTELPRGRLKVGAHDDDVNKPKQFSARLGNAVVTPDITLTTPEEIALDEIRQLVDIIYDQPETTRNICRKLYRFYVWGPHTKEETDVMESVVDEMVTVFTTNNFKIQPVIERLLSSQFFFDSNANYGTDYNYGSLIKSPVDLVLGTLKFFDIKLPAMTTDAVNFYKATGAILSQVRNQAMNFYNPYDVAGYEAYHQFPIYHRFWITPNTLTTRYNFIREIIDQTTSNDTFKTFDILTYIQNNAVFNAAAGGGSENFIRTLVAYLLPVTEDLNFDDATDDASTLTALRLGYFKSKLVNMTYAEGYYWSATPSLDDKRGFIRGLFNTILQSPEYQLA